MKNLTRIALLLACSSVAWGQVVVNCGSTDPNVCLSDTWTTNVPTWEVPKTTSVQFPEAYACSIYAAPSMPIVVEVKGVRMAFADIDVAAMVFRALRKAGVEASWRIEIPLCLEVEATQ